MRRYDKLSTEQKKTVEAIVEKAVDILEPNLARTALLIQKDIEPVLPGTPMGPIMGSIIGFGIYEDLMTKASENFRDLFSYFVDPSFSFQQYGGVDSFLFKENKKPDDYLHKLNK